MHSVCHNKVINRGPGIRTTDIGRLTYSYSLSTDNWISTDSESHKGGPGNRSSRDTGTPVYTDKEQHLLKFQFMSSYSSLCDGFIFRSFYEILKMLFEDLVSLLLLNMSLKL